MAKKNKINCFRLSGATLRVNDFAISTNIYKIFYIKIYYIIIFDFGGDVHRERYESNFKNNIAENTRETFAAKYLFVDVLFEKHRTNSD